MTRHAFLALAQRLGALSPTAAVQAEPERMAQWTARLLWAGSLADRRAPDADAVRAAVAEADRYSGRPQPAQPFPAPLPTWAHPALDAVAGAAR